jgi:tetratricopeptide (TPR) repeat protein
VAAEAFSICEYASEALTQQASAPLAFNRALVAERQAKTDDALAFYNKALQRDPTLGPARLNRAVLTLVARPPALPDELLPEIDQAVATGADPADADYARAVLHRQAGRPAEARLALERALQTRPGHPAARSLADVLKAVSSPPVPKSERP